MNKPLNLTFGLAGKLQTAIHKLGAPNTVGDVFAFIALKKTLDAVEQEQRNRTAEVLAEFGVKEGQLVPASDPNYPKIVLALSKLSDAESSTPVSCLQAYSNQEDMLQFIKSGKDLTMSESALIIEYLLVK